MHLESSFGKSVAEGPFTPPTIISIDETTKNRKIIKTYLERQEEKQDLFKKSIYQEDSETQWKLA